ncbi:MAG: ATP phosphoribosyltransferase regulatory subunit [bacterium]|nr:ATP phosphoribosyltransferase regulatory subunit [bacterium]
MYSVNSPMQGMDDVFGAYLRKRHHVIRLLSDFAQRLGFQQLEVPILERASSFSEEIVGKSPWPEWDKRGCFYLTVNNYSGSFGNLESQVEALLIPEGTISVTRWLGRLIQEQGLRGLPLKLFYDVQCFRNELVDKLSVIKRRQFRQFGVEILGSSSIAADMEIVCMINELLLLLGFPQESVVMRISDIRIFKQLVQESGLSYDDSLVIKELMDSIAESRAGKDPQAVPSLKKHFWACLDHYSHLTIDCRKKWECILDSSEMHISEETLPLFGEKYIQPFKDLNALTGSMAAHGVNAKVDLCVVRSHEYYTGISFEIDVVGDDASFYEIAGGGRYDRLVSCFLSELDENLVIPSTGFAFGIERVIEAATQFGLLSRFKRLESFSHFDETSADLLVIPPVRQNMCEAYLEAWSQVKVASSEKRHHIYVGENLNPEYLADFMSVYGITQKEVLT